MVAFVVTSALLPLHKQSRAASKWCKHAATLTDVLHSKAPYGNLSQTHFDPSSETTLCWEALIMGLYPGQHNLHDHNGYANPSIALIWRLKESWDRDGLSIWSVWSRWRDFTVNPTWPGRPWGSSRRALLWSGRPAAATPVWIKNGWLKTP